MQLLRYWPSFGLGLSETLLGAAFADRRSEVVLMTKFGLTAERRQDFDMAALPRSLDDSLRRLRTDYVDVLLLHNPPVEYLRAAHPVHEILEELRYAGKCRLIGASVDSPEDIDAALRSGRFDMLEVLYNLFSQRAQPTFAAAAAAGVGLVVKSPLDSGWLSGRHDAATRFEGGRTRWTPEAVACRHAPGNRDGRVRIAVVEPGRNGACFAVVGSAKTAAEYAKGAEYIRHLTAEQCRHHSAHARPVGEDPGVVDAVSGLE
jgi:aryl-alcohol dehydrogenase-like predicted oxidoreductase